MSILRYSPGQRVPEWEGEQAGLFVGKNLKNQLFRRFLLREYPTVKGAMELSQVVQPVAIVDQLVAVSKYESAALDLSAAAGTYTAAHTVPDGKRWHLTHIVRSSTVGASRTELKKAGGSGKRLLVTGTAEAMQSIDLWMDEGDSIGMTTTNEGADVNRLLIAGYMEYESFGSIT